jgi:hypothetical protein
MVGSREKLRASDADEERPNENESDATRPNENERPKESDGASS